MRCSSITLSPKGGKGGSGGGGSKGGGGGGGNKKDGWRYFPGVGVNINSTSPASKAGTKEAEAFLVAAAPAAALLLRR